MVYQHAQVASQTIEVEDSVMGSIDTVGTRSEADIVNIVAFTLVIIGTFAKIIAGHSSTMGWGCRRKHFHTFMQMKKTCF